jgi:perosamine synthetase
MPELIPVNEPKLGPRELEYVTEAVESGWISSAGRYIEEFESGWAAYCGRRHGIAVSNGTTALHAAVAALGLEPGDEVILPTFTIVSCVTAVLAVGAVPVLVDSEPALWTMDVGQLEARLTERTRAVMPVHMYGHPVEMDPLLELAERRGLAVLEDAAEAHGAEYRSGDGEWRRCGSFGAMSTFSFYANKLVTTGEGGMVVTDDDAVAARMRLLRSHGMTTLTWDRHRGHASAYDVVELGFNYRIDEPRAALGRRRLARLDDDNARRAELDARYREHLAGADGLVPALAPVDGARLAHHLFTVVLDEGVDRTRFRETLATRGVQTSVHYPPAHRFSIHATDAELPVTDAYGERAVTLPMFATMTNDQQNEVVEAIRAALGVTAGARG